MATTTTITKLLFRRGNDDDRKQTILASGEPGWVLDRKRLYIGDGVTPGGVPALDVRDDHLHYVDTPPGGGRRWTTVLENNNSGGAQFLDINIEGLSHTLAGDVAVLPDSFNRWFHPAAEDIRTFKDLIFTNDPDFNGVRDANQNQTAAIYHEGNQEFFIGKRNADYTAENTINIGNAIIITQKPNGNSTVNFTGNVDTTTVQALSVVFDNGVHTIFEDKTVDLNTSGTTDANGNFTAYKVVEEEPLTADSTGAGLYITHKNYLSAGCITIGQGDNGYFSWSSMWLRPTRYRTNWEYYDNHDYGNNDFGGLGDTGGGFLGRTQAYSSDNWDNIVYQDGESGTNNATNTTNGLGYVGTGWRPKPLIFQSVRPVGRLSDGTERKDQWGSSYKGDPHFVCEAGLIIYDAGDVSTGAYNAYKINQSVDTRGTPRFRSLKIRTDKHETDAEGDPIGRISSDDPDARLGTPIAVDSGGTGQNDFNPGSIITTTGNWNAAQQINEDALRSVRLEQGAFMVGTNTKGAVASKFDISNWMQIDYSDGTDSVATEDGYSLTTGVIKLNNTFSPEFLTTATQKYKDARILWFAKFDEIITDDAERITATGMNQNGADPGEPFMLRGDYFAPATESDDIVSRGGTIRTTSAPSTTPGNQVIKIEHNNLASTLFASGPQGVARVVKFQRNDADDASNSAPIQNVLISELFAGQTSASVQGSEHSKWYLNGLMPVTVDDAVNDTHADYVNKGYVMAGVQIDAGGHLIGFRSKDLDDRYPQMFYLGTGWKTNGQVAQRVQSPADHTENVSTLTDTDIDDAAIGVMVAHNSDKNMSTNNAYVPKNYMGEKRADAVVLTDINFNNYGTVHSYNTHDLTEIFYDKEQISNLARQIYTHVDQLSATIDDVQDNTFKRDASSHTNNSNLTTSWYDENTINFSHVRTTGSTIRQVGTYEQDEDENPILTSVDWIFSAESNTDIHIPSGRNIEWRHKNTTNGDTGGLLMSLEATAPAGGDTGGATLLDIYHENKSRFRFHKHEFTVRDQNEATKITISNAGITMGDSGADSVRLYGCASRAEKIWTQGAASDATKPWYHVGFVLNNNGQSTNSSGAQTLKTDSTLQFSPDNDVLKVTGNVLIDGDKDSGYDGYFQGKLQGSATRVDVTSTEYVTEDEDGVETWTDRPEARRTGSNASDQFHITFVHKNNTDQNDWDEQQMFTNKHLMFDAHSELLKVQGAAGVQIWNDLTLGADSSQNPLDRDVKIRFHEEKHSYQLIPDSVTSENPNGLFTEDLYNELLWKHIDNMSVPSYLTGLSEPTGGWLKYEEDRGGEFQLFFDKTNESHAILHFGNIEHKLEQLAIKNGGAMRLPEAQGFGSYIMQDEDYFFKGNLVGDIYSLDWYTDTRAGVEKLERSGRKILENGTDGSDAWFRGDVVLNDTSNTVLVDISSKYFKGTSDKADQLKISGVTNGSTYSIAMTDANAYGNFHTSALITGTIDDNGGEITLSCNIETANLADRATTVDVTKQTANTNNKHELVFVNNEEKDSEGNIVDQKPEALQCNTGLYYEKDTNGTKLTAGYFHGAGDKSYQVATYAPDTIVGTTEYSELDTHQCAVMLAGTTASQSDVNDTAKEAGNFERPMVDASGIKFDTKNNFLTVGGGASFGKGASFGGKLDVEGDIDADGFTVTATKLVGDGSGLTGLTIGNIEGVMHELTQADDGDSTKHDVVLFDGDNHNKPRYDSAMQVDPSTQICNFKNRITGSITGSSGSCRGNAATATKLNASVNIGGTSFDGSSSITPDEANKAGKLKTAVNIGGTSFDGSTDITPAKVALTNNTTDGTAYSMLFNKDGNINYSGHISYTPSTKTFKVGGDIIAYASDERLKKNIKPIDGALGKLLKIGGYTFNFNELGTQLVGTPGDERQVGVIAQEVEQVLPEIVAPAPADENYKTVKYEKLVPLLIESIKELSARVEQLESQLK